METYRLCNRIKQLAVLCSEPYTYTSTACILSPGPFPCLPRLSWQRQRLNGTGQHRRHSSEQVSSSALCLCLEINGGAHVAVEAKRHQELMRDLKRRFDDAERHLSTWLRGITEGLKAVAEASCASHVTEVPCTITDVRPTRPTRGGYNYTMRPAVVELEYQCESRSSAFGSWTAQVLSKSAQGEDGMSICHSLNAVAITSLPDI